MLGKNEPRRPGEAFGKGRPVERDAGLCRADAACGAAERGARAQSPNRARAWRSPRAKGSKARRGLDRLAAFEQHAAGRAALGKELNGARAGAQSRPLPRALLRRAPRQSAPSLTWAAAP